MKKILPAIAVILISLSGCTAQPFIKNIQVDEMQKLINEKVTIVDVRTSQEFTGGYISGAVNIDWYDPEFETKFKKYDHSKPIALYCRSGNRSGSAANKLKQMGFSKIYSLTGGINAWEASGKNVTK
ncbi:MAG TPA: rhodanese-like domain-containing protein [Bacteroidia bacterium]|nr:rhodanese-like domain-containing protein [Bacteroidia bacterium]